MIHHGHWILDEKGENPVPVDLMTWAKWFEPRGNRIVKQEQVGKYMVSTVFLGIDHNYEPDGAPILWETMVFDRSSDSPGHDLDMDRCSGNREQAEAMHQRMVEKWEMESAIE